MKSTGNHVDAILWHLLNEGTASLAMLSRLVGQPREVVAKALRRMRVIGQVQCPQHLADGDLRQIQYGLTKAGIHAALQLNEPDAEKPGSLTLEAAA